MLRTGAGDPTGENLAPFGHRPSQQVGILVIGDQILGTEFAHLLPEGSLAVSKTSVSGVVAPTVVGIPISHIVLIFLHTVSTPNSHQNGMSSSNCSGPGKLDGADGIL